MSVYTERTEKNVDHDMGVFARRWPLKDPVGYRMCMAMVDEAKKGRDRIQSYGKLVDARDTMSRKLNGALARYFGKQWKRDPIVWKAFLKHFGKLVYNHASCHKLDAEVTVLDLDENFDPDAELIDRALKDKR